MTVKQYIGTYNATEEQAHRAIAADLASKKMNDEIKERINARKVFIVHCIGSENIRVQEPSSKKAMEYASKLGKNPFRTKRDNIDSPIYLKHKDETIHFPSQKRKALAESMVCEY